MNDTVCMLSTPYGKAQLWLIDICFRDLHTKNLDMNIYDSEYIFSEWDYDLYIVL